MKLQIVEYKAFDVLSGEHRYSYVLQLDEKCLVWVQTSTEKKELKEVYDILMKSFLIECRDFKLEHAIRCVKIPGVDYKVLFEQEVSDTYLKEKFIESRIKDLESDFK